MSSAMFHLNHLIYLLDSLQSFRMSSCTHLDLLYFSIQSIQIRLNHVGWFIVSPFRSFGPILGVRIYNGILVIGLPMLDLGSEQGIFWGHGGIACSFEDIIRSYTLNVGLFRELIYLLDSFGILVVLGLYYSVHLNLFASEMVI